MFEWSPELGKFANDPEHDHMACAVCLPERLRIVRGEPGEDDPSIQHEPTIEEGM